MPEPRPARRVVITGLGVVAPLGTGVAALWGGLIEGRSGIRRINSFDPAALHCQVAGEVPDFDPAVALDPKLARRTDRHTQLALVAIRDGDAGHALVGGHGPLPRLAAVPRPAAWSRAVGHLTSPRPGG